jgi:hypothetical protein
MKIIRTVNTVFKTCGRMFSTETLPPITGAVDISYMLNVLTDFSLPHRKTVELIP